tara:strand:+ start:1365 stop:1895 length:531 start_codon:yes stop_codon:yes gene_type:complete
MIKLLTVFWRIMLRKSSPEDLPSSNFLFVSTLIFFLFSQIPVGMRLYESLAEFFQLLFLDVLLLSFWLRIILQLSGKLGRFRKSLIALFGTGGLFNLIVSPFFFVYAPYLKDLTSLDEVQIPAWISLIIFIVTIWSVLVMAHIFSKAISKTQGVGLVLALVYVFFNFLISSSISVS